MSSTYTEVLNFDGTVSGLLDQLTLLQAAMPKTVAFVDNPAGGQFNAIRVTSKTLTDGSNVWDVELFTREK